MRQANDSVFVFQILELETYDRKLESSKVTMIIPFTAFVKQSVKGERSSKLDDNKTVLVYSCMDKEKQRPHDQKERE